MELDQRARLVAIERSGIITLAYHQRLQDLCRNAFTSLGPDAVQLNVVTATHQVFIAEYPPPSRWRKPSPLSNSGCREVVLADQTLSVPDTTDHPVMCIMPWAKDWKAYLGAPVYFEDMPVGSLCALGRKTRKWSSTDQSLLESFAEKVTDNLKSLAS